MNRPTAINRLLEELEGEAIVSALETLKSSKMVIFLDDKSDADTVELSADETSVLLANMDTTQRLIDAIDRPSQASICLYDLQPADNVLELLEKSFAAVDEG